MDRLSPPSSISDALTHLPPTLLNRSGSVFYSGWQAFTGPRDLYILGLNPGGCPEEQSENTVERHIAAFYNRVDPWSEYTDESWEGAEPGTWGMQPRICHMLRQLGLHPQETPSSNVLFARTRNEAALSKNEKSYLLAQCWPVHNAVIQSLRIKVVLCLGATAGRWVRKQIGASAEIDSYRETNERRWRSQSHAAPDGKIVVTVTHPGRADWRNPDADPTPLIERALKTSLTPPSP